MVATDEHKGTLLAVEGDDKFLYHTDGLISVSWLAQAIAIEEYEVGLNAIQTSGHTIDNCLNSMQVVQNDCSKVAGRIGGQSEAIKGRSGATTEGFTVGLVFRYLLRTDTVIISLTWLQTIKTNAVLKVVDDLLSSTQLTILLGVQTVCAYFHPRANTATRLVHHRDTVRGHILQIWQAP